MRRDKSQNEKVMKKIILMLMAVLGLSATAMARDTYAHDASVLPQSAQTMLSSNFKAKVSVVKIDKTLGRIDDYEVILTDGTEISFDRNGNWDNVETSNAKSVPAGLVPEIIRNYVSRNHSGVHIVGIDKEHHGYDVELSDGIDMKFDKDGRFLRYDD